MPDVFIKRVDMGDIVCNNFRTFANTRLVLWDDAEATKVEMIRCVFDWVGEQFGPWFF